MTASTDEAREELRNRYPDVIRVVVGLVANAHPQSVSAEADAIASRALNIVIACDKACGIGGDA